MEENNYNSPEEEVYEEVEEEQEEGLLEEPEVLDEDQEYDESEESEDGETDIVDTDEDFKIDIPITFADGNTKRMVFDQDALTEVVNKGYAYDYLYQQAAMIQQQAQQSKALVDFVAQDPILARMTWMRANNIPEDEILNDIKTIMETMSMNNNTTDPYLDELDDAQKNIYLQMKRQQEEVANKSQQLEQQLQSLQSQKLVEDTASHNSRVFDNALADLGLDYDSKNDIPKIQEAVVALYPNIDPRVTKFNKQQAEAILQYAGLKRRSAKTTSKIQQVTKAKSAPRVLGGSKSSGTNKRQVPPASLGNSIEDRRKALLNLGF